MSKLPQWDRIAADSMDELGRCQSAGKVRFRGISSHHPDVLHAALESGLTASGFPLVLPGRRS